MSLEFLRDEIISLLQLRDDKVRIDYDMVICEELAVLSNYDLHKLVYFCEDNNLWFSLNSYMFDKAGFCLYVYKC